MNEGRYDAIVVGSGPVGAHVAKVLGDAGKRVLVLEAGRNSGATWESYQSFLETYYTAVIKEPNSPYPQNASAPSPLATDILRIRKGTPDLVGYQVELGPQAFGSTYLRSLAGTSLHWLGTTPRFVPNDFRMQSEYGVGVDWPITYDDVQPYYCEAEWSMGVAANVEDQAKLGVWFPDGYEYPMERIPPSFSDTIIQRATAKATVRLGDGRTYPVRVSSLAQARNSGPRTHRILVNGRDRNGYTPVGAVGKPEVGVRCEGNASCIPICPVQAKYSALKTLAQCDPRLVTVHTQCIVTKLHIGGDGRITGVDYLTYDVEGTAPKKKSAAATIYVLAGHAVENAKLLLASNAANSSDQVGRNLMDQLFYITWARANEPVGAFRGPGQTSGIETLRDGPFRSQFAAFRIDVGNWGWDVATFPPDGDVAYQLAHNVFGKRLRQFFSDLYPRQVRIGYDIEQLPDAKNRVTISREYLDASGCFRPVISYSVSEYTWQAMLEAAKVSTVVFDAMRIPRENQYFGYKPPPELADARWFIDRDGTKHYLSFIGTGHHIGTHRMGKSRTDSVVDRHQRSWDHENLYVVGCGSFPTGGTANPTLTAVALTLMSTKDMLRQLR